jgi:hypothetical protein
MKSIHDKYITIQGWMVTALKLKGSELQLFALIHGFCQDGKSRFSGSLSYIETWLNASRPTAIAALNRLTLAGWIVKHAAPVNQSNEYSVNWKAVNKAKEVVKNLYHQAETGSKETLPEVVKKFNGGSKESLPNIYSNTDNENIESAPAQFLVTTVALETIEPAQNEYTATAPNWMDVARQMLEYSKGEGKDQYQFLCEGTKFTGDPMLIFTTWAGKASPYQLKNWKKEFSKLGTWFNTEAQRRNKPNGYQQATQAQQTQIIRDL